MLRGRRLPAVLPRHRLLGGPTFNNFNCKHRPFPPSLKMPIFRLLGWASHTRGAGASSTAFQLGRGPHPRYLACHEPTSRMTRR